MEGEGGGGGWEGSNYDKTNLSANMKMVLHVFCVWSVCVLTLDLQLRALTLSVKTSRSPPT